jgi:ribonuclease Z
VKLLVVGTGSGKVEIDAFHTSFLVSDSVIKLLIDCGDSAAKSLLTNKININSLTHILISHNHPDHFSGLPNLINQMYMQKRKKDLTIFTHINLVEATRYLLYLNYIFDEKLSFNLNVVPFEHETAVNINDVLKVIPVRNNHIRNKYNVKSVNESYFVSSSFIIQSKTNSALFTSDLMDERDLNLFEKYEVKYLFLESTHIDFTKLNGYRTIQNADKIFLTHYERNKVKIIQKQIKKLHPSIVRKMFFLRQSEILKF